MLRHGLAVHLMSYARRIIPLTVLGLLMATSVVFGQIPDTEFPEETTQEILFTEEPSLDSLQTQLKQMQIELEQLRNDQQQAPIQNRLSGVETGLQRLQNQFTETGISAGRPRSTDVSPTIRTTTNPTYPNTRVTGFFQVDAGFIHQDSVSTQQFGDIQDARGFRRARLAAVGDISKNISYMLEMDFAQPGRPSFMDVWGDIHNVPLFGNIRVGQWRQPFGMDELTSVRELTFLERPTMFALAPFRQVGIGFHDTNEEQSLTWAASVYGYPTDPNYGDSVGDAGYGFATRVTAVFEDACNPSNLIHLGGGYSINDPNLVNGASHNNARFANVPEFGGVFFGPPTGTTSSMPNFYDTGFIPSSGLSLYNLELAGVYGSWHGQSELRFAQINSWTQGTIVIPTYYAQVGYILTGEVRPYNKQAGVLGRIKPLHAVGDGGIGAWEVAARYSYVNANQAQIPADVISPTLHHGGELNDFTVGLNWYLHANAKLQFQYVRAVLNRAPLGHSNTDIIALRAQVDF